MAELSALIRSVVDHSRSIDQGCHESDKYKEFQRRIIANFVRRDEEEGGDGIFESIKTTFEKTAYKHHNHINDEAQIGHFQRIFIQYAKQISTKNSENQLRIKPNYCDDDFNTKHMGRGSRIDDVRMDLKEWQHFCKDFGFFTTPIHKSILTYVEMVGLFEVSARADSLLSKAAVSVGSPSSSSSRSYINLSAVSSDQQLEGLIGGADSKTAQPEKAKVDFESVSVYSSPPSTPGKGPDLKVLSPTWKRGLEASARELFKEQRTTSLTYERFTEACTRLAVLAFGHPSFNSMYPTEKDRIHAFVKFIRLNHLTHIPDKLDRQKRLLNFRQRVHIQDTRHFRIPRDQTSTTANEMLDNARGKRESNQVKTLRREHYDKDNKSRFESRASKIKKEHLSSHKKKHGHINYFADIDYEPKGNDDDFGGTGDAGDDKNAQPRGIKMNGSDNNDSNDNDGYDEHEHYASDEYSDSDYDSDNGYGNAYGIPKSRVIATGVINNPYPKSKPLQCGKKQKNVNKAYFVTEHSIKLFQSLTSTSTPDRWVKYLGPYLDLGTVQMYADKRHRQHKYKVSVQNCSGVTIDIDMSCRGMPFFHAKYATTPLAPGMSRTMFIKLGDGPPGEFLDQLCITIKSFDHTTTIKVPVYANFLDAPQPHAPISPPACPLAIQGTVKSFVMHPSTRYSSAVSQRVMSLLNPTYPSHAHAPADAQAHMGIGGVDRFMETTQSTIPMPSYQQPYPSQRRRLPPKPTPRMQLQLR